MPALKNQPPNNNAKTTIQTSIRTFVLDKFPACQQQKLTDTDSLIESGIIDSMGILDLVAFTESEFNIQIQDTDLTPENFESIAALTDFVVAKTL